jgi:XRE family transcriptional regulator, regulator of sulfur utilization
MDLGTTIKKYRNKKGINQKTFAKKCEISQAFLSQIENNKKDPTLSILKSISKCLDIPLPLLFFLSLEPKDIKASKRQAFELVEKPIKSLIEQVINFESND